MATTTMRPPARRHPDRTVGRLYVRRVLAGGLVVVVATTVLSVVEHLVVAHQPDDDHLSVLVAMGAIALAGYTASVLQGVGGERAAMTGLLVAGIVALTASLAGGHVGLVVVVAVTGLHLAWLPVIVLVFHDPERVFAARL